MSKILNKFKLINIIYFLIFSFCFAFIITPARADSAKKDWKAGETAWVQYKNVYNFIGNIEKISLDKAEVKIQIVCLPIDDKLYANVSDKITCNVKDLRSVEYGLGLLRTKCQIHFDFFKEIASGILLENLMEKINSKSKQDQNIFQNLLFSFLIATMNQSIEPKNDSDIFKFNAILDKYEKLFTQSGYFDYKLILEWLHFVLSGNNEILFQYNYNKKINLNLIRNFYKENPESIHEYLKNFEKSYEKILNLPVFDFCCYDPYLMQDFFAYYLKISIIKKVYYEIASNQISGAESFEYAKKLCAKYQNDLDTKIKDVNLKKILSGVWNQVSSLIVDQKSSEKQMTNQIFKENSEKEIEKQNLTKFNQARTEAVEGAYNKLFRTENEIKDYYYSVLERNGFSDKDKKWSSDLWFKYNDDMKQWTDIYRLSEKITLTQQFTDTPDSFHSFEFKVRLQLEYIQLLEKIFDYMEKFISCHIKKTTEENVKYFEKLLIQNGIPEDKSKNIADSFVINKKKIYFFQDSALGDMLMNEYKKILILKEKKKQDEIRLNAKEYVKNGTNRLNSKEITGSYIKYYQSQGISKEAAMQDAEADIKQRKSEGQLFDEEQKLFMKELGQAIENSTSLINIKSDIEKLKLMAKDESLNIEKELFNNASDNSIVPERLITLSSSMDKTFYNKIPTLKKVFDFQQSLENNIKKLPDLIIKDLLNQFSLKIPNKEIIKNSVNDYFNKNPLSIYVHYYSLPFGIGTNKKIVNFIFPLILYQKDIPHEATVSSVKISETECKIN